jgi:hypothetical protein
MQPGYGQPPGLTLESFTTVACILGYIPAPTGGLDAISRTDPTGLGIETH